MRATNKSAPNWQEDNHISLHTIRKANENFGETLFFGKKNFGENLFFAKKDFGETG